MPFTVLFISTIKFMKLFNHFVIESVPHSIFCLTEPNRNDTRYKHVCYKRWNAFLFCDVFFLFFQHTFSIYANISSKNLFHFLYVGEHKKWSVVLSYHFSLFQHLCVRHSFCCFVRAKNVQTFPFARECKHFGMICIFFPSSLFVCVVSDLWLNL